MVFEIKRRASKSEYNFEGDETRPVHKRSKVKSVPVHPFMDKEAFSSNMRDTDLARIELDRERSAVDRLERELEHGERKKYRERN